MNSYLKIAHTILRSTRRPMSARAILEVAHKSGSLPSHLFGATQHKTLQARLSEDILHHRDASMFYRTEPGQFFLVEFLEDPDIPDDWKSKFPARRRTRDLKRSNTLGVKRAFLDNWRNRKVEFNEFFEYANSAGALKYLHPDDMEKQGYCSTWTFSTVFRDDLVLGYRVGRYRDDRDSYANKKSVGFPGALSIDDVSLFSNDDLGVVECAISVLSQDLDLSHSIFHGDKEKLPEINYVLIEEDEENSLNLIILLSWKCPDWFEPTTRRLSINEPRWMCKSVLHNDIHDFEPWSSRLLNDWTAVNKQKPIG